MIKEPSGWEIECDDCGAEFPDAFEFHDMDADDVIAAVDLNATLNDQCAEHPHRVAVREVSPWCEMKRKVVC